MTPTDEALILALLAVIERLTAEAHEALRDRNLDRLYEVAGDLEQHSGDVARTAVRMQKAER